jgi:hypothetical protein
MYSCHCGAFSVCSHHTIIICALHLPYARNAAVTLRGVVCCISAFTAVMYSSTAIVTRAYDRPVVCCRHKQPEICCFARPLQHGIMDRAILCWRASIFSALSRVSARSRQGWISCVLCIAHVYRPPSFCSDTCRSRTVVRHLSRIDFRRLLYHRVGGECYAARRTAAQKAQQEEEEGQRRETWAKASACIVHAYYLARLEQGL